MNGERKLSRDDWLRLALQHIATQGHVKIRIYQLAKALGVTEGSFYWHFANRQDFLNELIEFWADNYTANVVEAIDRVRGSARDRLSALVNKVVEENLSQFDRVIWAIAVQEPALAKAINRIYQTRLDFVGSLFAEMGFKDFGLDLRTRSFVAFMSMENNYFRVKNKKKRQKLIEDFIAHYTRVSSETS